MKLTATLALVASLANAAPLQCPTLTCKPQDEKLGPITNDICFKHSINQPVTELKSYKCEWYQDKDNSQNVGPVVCEFDLMSGQYAWINERYQPKSTEEDSKNSVLKTKKTEAYCVEVSSLDKNLNNGRTCSASW